jgi:azurin
MNIRALFVPTVAALVLSGCGQKDTYAKAAASSETAAPPAATAPATGPRTIEITANDQMKFNVTSIEAKPGEELKVTLTNLGSLPKEAMGHNWILLKQGSDGAAFSAAAAAAREQNYVPPALQDQIIAKIDLLGPHKTGEVTFKAPDQPGEYPFLCSFPGHFPIGMKGTLTVK